MFRRVNKGMNPLTNKNLESLNEKARKIYLGSLENITLQRIQFIYDSVGVLTERQKEVSRAVFWELYSRERPTKEPNVLTSSDSVQNVDHRTRFLKAREKEIVKDANVKAKRHRKREAEIAKKCGHTGSKTTKSRSAASPTVESDDVVNLMDVRWDVHLERYYDEVDEYMHLLAELAENEPETEDQILGT